MSAQEIADAEALGRKVGEEAGAAAFKNNEVSAQTEAKTAEALANKIVALKARDIEFERL